MVIQFVTFVFEIFAIAIAFQAYKEFKAALFEYGGGSAGLGSLMGGRGDNVQRMA